MGRKKVKSGDLLRIPLFGNMGYAYAKYIDLTQVLNQDMATFIRVYQYWNNTDDFKIEEILQSDYLIQPLIVAGLTPTISKKQWQIIGHSEPTLDELIIPHFRSHNPLWEDEINSKEWCYIEGFDLEEKKVTSLNNLKHLERWVAMGTGNIEIRITLQIIKKEGLKFEDFLDMNDERVQYQHKLAQESPLLSEIPESLNGRAIIK